MFEEGPGLAQDRLHAELTIESGNCTIEISPEFPQAQPFAPKVRSATLQVGSMVLSLSSSTSPLGRITLTGSALPTQRASEKINWAPFWTPLNLPMVNWQVHAPGAQRRRLSIERRLCTGQYALLTLSLLDSTPDVRTNEEGARYQSGRTYRILIPLPTAATNFPAAGGEQ